MNTRPTTPILDRLTLDRPRPGNRIRVARLDATVELETTALWDGAGRVAHGLARMGLGRGDRIGVMAANSLEWVLLDLAAVRLGAVVAGLEPGRFDPGAGQRYGLAAVFTDRPGAPGHHDLAQVRDLARLDAPSDEQVAALDPVYRTPAEPFAVKFTSGSTGTPKSLVATAGGVECSMAGVQELFGHGPGDDLFVFLPLSLLQQRYWVYSALAFGHDLTISTYEAAFVTMRHTRPTVVMGVPAFFEAARRHIDRQAAGRPGPPRDARGSAAQELFGDRIRYLWTGSAPAAQPMLEFYDDHGMPIYEGYGMNETCIVTKNAPGASRRGSVGRPLPGRRVLIGDDGVVSVAGEVPVATGYEYAPAGATEQVFVAEGLVRTGDLGHLDGDGFLFLDGRADDVIVLENGRKVVVRPIEEFVKLSPAVAECVLFCPHDAAIVAVVSPAGRVDADAVREQVALANATFGHDEQIARVVVAAEPFTVVNELLTTQHKPRRSRILAAHRSEITQIGAPTHVR